MALGARPNTRLQHLAERSKIYSCLRLTEHRMRERCFSKDISSILGTLRESRCNVATVKRQDTKHLEMKFSVCKREPKLLPDTLVPLTGSRICVCTF